VGVGLYHVGTAPIRVVAEGLESLVGKDDEPASDPVDEH
jgi:hypothetical protein